jgi:hypothetical protein
LWTPPVSSYFQNPPPAPPFPQSLSRSLPLSRESSSSTLPVDGSTSAVSCADHRRPRVQPRGREILIKMGRACPS